MLLHKEMTIGQRFKHFRLQAGMSQAELTEGICSVAVVSHIETDRSVPSAHTMGKLAERLRVPLQEIMGETESLMDVNYQIEVIRVYLEKRDYEHALDLITKLDQRNDLLDHQRTLLFVCHAEALVKMKRNSEAIALLLPFLEKQQILQTVNDETFCDLYNKLGNAYYWANDFEKAFSAFEQGYRASLKLPEFGLVAARVTKNLGLTCYQLGFKDDARRYLEKGYSYFDRVTEMGEMANTLFYLALATGNGEQMLKARLLYESMNQINEAILAKLHYAFYVESESDHNNALKELESCSSEFEKNGDYSMSIYALSLLVMLCVENNCTHEAERYLKLAESYNCHLLDEDSLQIADFYRAKAMYLMDLKNYKEAIANAMKSTEICAKMGLHVHGTDSLLIVAESYHKQGLNEEAYKVSKKINELLRQPLRRNDQ